jgi:hypothetical protein
MFRFKKISFFAIFRLSAVHVYFSSTIRIQKYTGFKKPAVLRCLDDPQICSSNVFFINNQDPKLRLNPHQKHNNFGSTTLLCTVGSGSIWNGLGNIQIHKLRNAGWGAFSLAYPVSISILTQWERTVYMYIRNRDDFWVVIISVDSFCTAGMAEQNLSSCRFCHNWGLFPRDRLKSGRIG